jgi:hypothetical protein
MSLFVLHRPTLHLSDFHRKLMLMLPVVRDFVITFQPFVHEGSVSDCLVIYLSECCILCLSHMLPLLKRFFKVEAVYLVLKLYL